jgi:hypothetical protein
MRYSIPVIVAALLSTVIAHPGHDHSKEIAERAAFMKSNKRSLSDCSEQIKKRGLEQRAIHRRAAKVKQALDRRQLEARDLAEVLATSHNSSIAAFSSADVLFASNGSCTLSPEVTQGPYCKLKLTFIVAYANDHA